MTPLRTSAIVGEVIGLLFVPHLSLAQDAMHPQGFTPDMGYSFGLCEESKGALAQPPDNGKWRKSDIRCAKVEVGFRCHPHRLPPIRLINSY